MNDKIAPPDDTPAYMYDAWASCLSWSLGEDDIMATFREETGTRWTPGRTKLEQAIDKATGADIAFLEAYVRWFNANVWGRMDQPIPDEDEEMEGSS